MSPSAIDLSTTTSGSAMHAAPFLGGLAEPVSALIQDDKNAEPQPCLGMFVPGIPSRRRGILNLGNWRLLYIVLDLSVVRLACMGDLFDLFSGEVISSFVFQQMR